MYSLQRGISVRDFLIQEFTVSANGFLSWLITTSVFSVLLSVIISQYIPFVPKLMTSYSILNIQPNKFGYTLGVILAFYLLKAILTYFFYQATGTGRKWAIFYFTNTKFYFVWSLVLMVLCFILFYTPINRSEFFVYSIILMSISFIFKIFYYLFHKNEVLPKEWYYKFLYICTLQIIPLLVLWNLLFF